jgi:hypothetical protein
MNKLKLIEIRQLAYYIVRREEYWRKFLTQIILTPEFSTT